MHMKLHQNLNECVEVCRKVVNTSPLSSKTRITIKNWFFSTFPFLFKETKLYKYWEIRNNIDFSPSFCEDQINTDQEF